MRIDEGSKFGFPWTMRLQFYLQYVWIKTVSFWREVKTPRLRLFIYEVVYSIRRFIRYPPPRLAWLRLNRVVTTFGVFNIRPGTTDAAIVSPGFERQDLDHLLTILSWRLSAGRTVLFLDIGANIGTYAISVTNRLRRLGEIRALAFEPAQSSCALLHENVVANDLREIVDVRQMGLGDGSIASATMQFNSREPGGHSLNPSLVWRSEQRETVEISTIDKQVNTEALADVVALKLDVEGSEIAVLKGAIATLAAAQEVLLLVEDFLDESVVAYLEATGWLFQGKFTPYNSFWSYSPSAQPE